VAATDPITTSITRRDGVDVLAVGGEIDLATAPVLECAIAAVLAGNPAAFVIDLSEVDFLASAGLQILVETRGKIRRATAFAVVANGPVTSRPIHLTRIDEYFDLYPTLDDALIELRPSEAREA
jgi:anti-sigma B factor antagonist